ncbi:MAG: 4Fe-4S binding protein [Candidatus Neomarinimicrobiota bacterium]|jgi:ferredoxin|nr:4Fe-4S binding protein [Candidatus Neomarinimicrobiota bacterium]MDD3965509.1 4Fe-4S binding protein [Candidatus Neomarinimicrobiota bacterium]MDX9780388.1 4Fe-4S binding protein [bacterium]
MLLLSGHCDQCGTCIAVCPADALMLTESLLSIDHQACTLCGLCVNICPIGALELKNEA